MEIILAVIGGMVLWQLVVFVAWAVTGQNEDVALITGCLVVYGVTKGIYNLCTPMGRRSIYSFFQGSACVWDTETYYHDINEREIKTHIELKRFGLTKKFTMSPKEAQRVLDVFTETGIFLAPNDYERKLSKRQTIALKKESCFHK